MNIQYRGASDNTNGRRFAEIQYMPRETDSVNKFISLIEEDGYKCFAEDEVVTIEVSDREDYEYVKSLYKAYNKFDWIAYIKDAGLKDAVDEWYSGILTDYGLYERCENDVDLYIILDNEGYKEEGIRDFMYRVSGASDAYNNAVSEFYQIICNE